MRAVRGRVVVASALPDETDALRRMLMDAGFSETVCVSDGLNAVRQAQESPTDAVIADAMLPVLDGFAVERKLSELSLNVYPAVIFLVPKGMRMDIPACMLEKPVNAQMLIDAVESLQPCRRRIPEEKRIRAAYLLDQIGIPEHCGREYLLRAVEMVLLDARLVRALSQRIYPALAQQFGADEKHIARAMRHVIDAAWRGGEMEAQYQIFGDTIDAGRGSPTLSEMISRIADILRWEGRA